MARYPRSISDHLDHLEAWVADAKADDAAAARVRERWLRQQAGEQTRFSFVLADACSRDVPVRIGVAGGSARAGRLNAVGHDFVSLLSTRGAEVLIALDAVTVVEVAASSALGGGREPDDDLDAAAERTWLADRLADAAAERARVEMLVRGGSRLVGELRAAGVDVVVVRSETSAPVDSYVPSSSVSAVTFLGSG